MNIPKQLNAFFSGDTPHNHAIGTSSIQYPINQVVHLRFVCDVLNFGIII
jgi:hypothetical protein